jgi:hypothetical protein
MWMQGDGSMLEELAGRTNFMNRARWWQHHLESIKAHDVHSKSKSKSHVLYPALLNLDPQKRSPEEIDQLAKNVAAVRKAGGSKKAMEQAVQANCAHCGCALLAAGCWKIGACQDWSTTKSITSGCRAGITYTRWRDQGHHGARD